MDDRAAPLAEITDQLNRPRSPSCSAEHFRVAEIFDPRDTRPLLCEFAEIAAPLRTGATAFAYRA